MGFCAEEREQTKIMVWELCDSEKACFWIQKLCVCVCVFVSVCLICRAFITCLGFLVYKRIICDICLL